MNEKQPKLTPMMKQLMEAKRTCPNAIILFRMGDFYEMFLEDAKVAAETLGLSLTSREKGPDAMPMAGFPVSQVDAYIARLVNAGHRIGVCEQVEDPKKAKGIVRREIVRIVTAGTVTEDTILDPRTSNFLVSICLNSRTPKLEVGLSWIELSTGAFYAVTIAKDALLEHLARIAPSEIIYSDKDPFTLPDYFVVQRTSRPDWAFNFRTAKDALYKQLKTNTLGGFGFDENDNENIPAICAAGAIVDYLNETQRNTLNHIDTLTPYRIGSFMEIDESSRLSLELTRTIRTGKREGSLLGVLDKCITPMGSRMIADWVASPLMDVTDINARYDAVSEFLTERFNLANIRENLRKVHDVQRLMTRLSQNRSTPRDLGMIAQSLLMLPFFVEQLTNVESSLLNEIRESIDPCTELRQTFDRALRIDLPGNSRDGGIIRDNYNKELDELHNTRRLAKEWMLQYQTKEITRTGIPSLKVGYTQVFGYYIEITNTYKRSVPSNYKRSHTIKNAERYKTPELDAYAEKVLMAEANANEIEQRLFGEICATTLEYRHKLQRTAVAIAKLDVLVTLAILARQNRYCRPVILDVPEMKVVAGRHAVIEHFVDEGNFVPNDINLDHGENGMIQLLTGPNMAGKSTFIRQAALICIMAQIGSFVPAREAALGVCDRIFARVGANDEIARGLSTFMVEMIETARILNQATSRSLVILDEVGRGTSTYDGVSLAWAICEHLHNQICCRTLFATHYHELTELSDNLDLLQNLNVAINELNEEVIFLHKIVPGAASQSYGIHVAKLAGLPKEVIVRSREILSELEKNHTKLIFNAEQNETPILKTIAKDTNLESNTASNTVARSTRSKQKSTGNIQLSLFGQDDHPIIEEFRHLKLENLTPTDALQLLEKWKKSL